MPKAYSIVGTQFTGVSEAFMAALKPGADLVLMREPTNKFDPKAIAVYADGQRIGYIPKNQNAVVSQFIDQTGVEMALDASLAPQKSVPAKFVRSPNSNFPMVEV